MFFLPLDLAFQIPDHGHVETWAGFPRSKHFLFPFAGTIRDALVSPVNCDVVPLGKAIVAAPNRADQCLDEFVFLRLARRFAGDAQR